MSFQLVVALAEHDLQNDRSRVLQRARNGSLPDIHAVANAVKRLPDLCTVEVATMLCSYLTATEVLDLRRALLPGSPAMDPARLGMVCLSRLSWLVAGDPTLSGPIVQEWPGIVKWMAFLAGTHGRMDSQDLSGALGMVTEALDSFLLHLFGHPGEAIYTTPGLFALTALLWMKEDEVTVTRPRQPPMASSSLVTLLDITKDDTILDIVIRGAGGKASTVAELALSRLRSALMSQAPRALDVYIYVDVVKHFAGKQGPLRRALLRNGAIAVVLDALFKMLKMLANTNAQTENARTLGMPLMACFRFIQGVTSGRDGIVAIRVAIQQGLLQALIDTSSLLHHFTKEEQSEITLFLTKIIPTYLVYGSVVSIFHAALARLKNKAKIYSLTPTVKAGPDDFHTANYPRAGS